MSDPIHRSDTSSPQWITTPDTTSHRIKGRCCQVPYSRLTSAWWYVYNTQYEKSKYPDTTVLRSSRLTSQQMLRFSQGNANEKNLKHSIWSSSTYGSKCQSDVFKRTSDVGQVPRAVTLCIHRCVKSSLPGAMSVTPATATSLSALSWTFIRFSRAITISSCSIPTNTPLITRDGVTHHSFNSISNDWNCECVLNYL